MSDFTVNAQCPECKTRFAMDDGIPCDCLAPVICPLCENHVDEEDAEIWRDEIFHASCLESLTRENQLIAEWEADCGL